MDGQEAAQPLAPLGEHDLTLLQCPVRHLVVLDDKVLANYDFFVGLFRETTLHQLILPLPRHVAFAVEHKGQQLTVVVAVCCVLEVAGGSRWKKSVMFYDVHVLHFVLYLVTGVGVVAVHLVNCIHSRVLCLLSH